MKTEQEKIISHWNAYIYEREENEEHIARCMMRLVGEDYKRVLEPACGGGKLCVPLAKAGHNVCGMDMDEEMLCYARKKANAMQNLRLLKGDILSQPWGGEYDAVILGANLLLNITTDWEYKQAQKQLIHRAATALCLGGMLILDFDCPLSLDSYSSDEEKVCFEGTDDRGVYGRYLIGRSIADEHSRIVKGSRRYEMTLPGGETFCLEKRSVKHFPTMEEVCAWLYRAGFTIESIWGGYENQPFDKLHRRAIIKAMKK